MLMSQVNVMITLLILWILIYILLCKAFKKKIVFLTTCDYLSQTEIDVLWKQLLYEEE